MEEVCSNSQYNVLLLMISDIIAESSEILFVGKDKKSLFHEKSRFSLIMPGRFLRDLWDYYYCSEKMKKEWFMVTFIHMNVKSLCKA